MSNDNSAHATDEKDAGLQVFPADIDAHILPLLRRVNQHPSFRTVGSCGGHYQLCSGRVAQRKTERRDSMPCMTSSAEKHRPGWREPITSLLCDGNFPDLMFCVHHPDNPDMLRLLTLLRYAPKGTDYALTPHRGQPGGYTFHYSAEHGCEAFWLSEREELESRPRFHEFWQFFGECWNHAVQDPKLHLTPEETPTRFDQDPRRRRRCLRDCLGARNALNGLPLEVGATAAESAMMCGDLLLGDIQDRTFNALFDHHVAQEDRRKTAQDALFDLHMAEEAPQRPDESLGWGSPISPSALVG